MPHSFCRWQTKEKRLHRPDKKREVVGEMKKICLNCEFCDVAFPDIDVRELKEEENYLICLLKNAKTDDYGTCKKWMKSKAREADLKAGC